MPRVKLDDKLIGEIAAFIRKGGFPQVAAETAGISREQFTAWLTRARQPRPPYMIRKLSNAVRQAVAHARLLAEIEVFQKNPLAWLKQGPGKERADNPGWTTTVKPVISQTNQHINLLLDPQFNMLFAALLQRLAPFPEARAALAEALAGVQERPKVIEALPTSSS